MKTGNEELLNYSRYAKYPQNTHLPWLGYVIRKAKEKRIHNLFFSYDREDAIQIFVTIALEAEKAETEGTSNQKVKELITGSIYEHLKDCGFKRQYKAGQYLGHHKNTNNWSVQYERWEEVGFDSGQRENSCLSGNDHSECGVPECKNDSAYNDEKYGRLCVKHKNYLDQRKKWGWKDPYNGIEKNNLPIYKKRPYEINHNFWELIRSHLTDEEWTDIWRKANGLKSKIGDELFEKIFRAWLNGCKGNNSLQKRFSPVFVDLTCQKCGQLFEVDLLLKTPKRHRLPDHCPNCGGELESDRTYLITEALKKKNRGKITIDEVASLTGYKKTTLQVLSSYLKNQGLNFISQKLDDPFYKQIPIQIDFLEEKIAWQARSSFPGPPDNDFSSF
ncbi:MAG TPA: hypothetical protein VKO42_03775 [Patescibacteria group bacterium]|nr:hypothetical protein [Patescibacteria group bacterium]